jgi:hypothetical protein
VREESELERSRRIDPIIVRDREDERSSRRAIARGTLSPARAMRELERRMQRLARSSGERDVMSEFPGSARRVFHERAPLYRIAA